MATKNFAQAWSEVKRTGNVYHPDLFATSIYAPQPTTHMRSRPTPLQAAQNKARADAHASNMRAHNKALDDLERWARKARYGGAL